MEERSLQLLHSQKCSFLPRYSLLERPQRPRIELVEIGRQCIDHCRAQDVPDIEHNVAGSAALNKGLQLIF